MSLNEIQLKSLLGKYLDGSLTDVESKQLDEWYASIAGNAGQKEIFESELAEQAEYAFLLKNIHEKINISSEGVVSLPEGKKKRLGLLMKIAAAVTAFLIIAFPFYYRANLKHSEPSIAMDTVKVDVGQLKIVELNDGSKIWLNSASKLIYPKSFSAKLREVTLVEGEGFFEIAHDTTKPFIVHSKGINTQVLGTSFNVSAYSYSNNISVMVASGKVAVSKGKKLIDFLLPNEGIKYSIASGKSIKEVTKSAAIAAWTNGNIILDQVDFESLKAIIFDNYGYVLKRRNSQVSHLRFSATLKKTDNIADVMKLLSSINHTKYLLTKKEITMY